VKGIELKVLRIRAGVRQYELAAKLGMNPSRLSLLENERLPLPSEVAERARSALQYEPNAATSGEKGDSVRR